MKGAERLRLNFKLNPEFRIQNLKFRIIKKCGAVDLDLEL
jgi:hypothetical protein